MGPQEAGVLKTAVRCLLVLLVVIAVAVYLVNKAAVPIAVECAKHPNKEWVAGNCRFKE